MAQILLKPHFGYISWKQIFQSKALFTKKGGYSAYDVSLFAEIHKNGIINRPKLP